MSDAMKVGVVTYVHGWYHAYIPFFIRAWELAYPEYDIVIVSDVARQCPAERVHWHTLPNPHPKATKPYYLRWLLPPEIFAGLDFAFICDVDLLALHEATDLLSTRLRVMELTQRPFANWVRPPAPGYPHRVTGWHFIDVEKYYKAVWPVAKKILENPEFDISVGGYEYDNGIGEKQWGQEALLYRILDDAFGLDAADRAVADSFANHHGLHLGPLRGGMTRSTIMQRLGRNAHFWFAYEPVKKLLADAVFQQAATQITEEKAAVVMHRLYRLFELPYPVQFGGEPREETPRA